MNNETNFFQNVLFVIVLYKQKLYESESYNSLISAIGEFSIIPKLTLYIYDNSPQNEIIDHTNPLLNIIYEVDYMNSGLSIAYEKALNYSIENNFKWILLLDQDSILNKNYLNEILLNINNLDESLAGIVPRIYSSLSDKLLSPSKVYFDHIFVPTYFKRGIIFGNVSAFNSGSLFKVEILKKLQIFPNNFVLDNLDHFIYKKINLNNLKVIQLDSIIIHSLSIENFSGTISSERYKKMIESEFILIKDSNLVSKFLFRLRLIYRLIKQSRYTNKIFFKITFDKLIGTKF